MVFRHAVVRLMSLCHGSALEEISGNSIQVDAIDTLGLVVAVVAVATRLVSGRSK